MRRVAWGLLLAFTFAVPWEYSLDLGPPLGNVARILGIALLLVAIPAILQARQLRTPGLLQVLVLAFFLWICCTYFWTIDQAATLTRIRGYFQELMIVWLIWEFAESAADLRWMLRAYVAGSWVLAALTVANFRSVEAIAAGQMRFAAAGQDPNDVARFLNLGLPLAALLVGGERRWPGRLLALGYLPLGLFAVLLTASRSGFLVACVALAGCGMLLIRVYPRALVGALLALSAVAGALWLAIPSGIIARLATIPAQLEGGDLNQRWNIWFAGWHAFVHAPLWGAGAGTFVRAAGTAAIDTAHNSALSLVVGGGLVALFLATAIVAAAFWMVPRTGGAVWLALHTALLVWLITSLTATVEESRTTWLLMGLVALAARLHEEAPQSLTACFAWGEEGDAARHHEWLPESPAGA